ncbi:hypothetical protein FO519_004570 [Halicephalobus sp. NKZ332]|nr:hypothetical protein FO519_004570 [Halicephalobus sp. NKZ332]
MQKARHASGCETPTRKQAVNVGSFGTSRPFTDFFFRYRQNLSHSVSIDGGNEPVFGSLINSIGRENREEDRMKALDAIINLIETKDFTTKNRESIRSDCISIFERGKDMLTKVELKPSFVKAMTAVCENLNQFIDDPLRKAMFDQMFILSTCSSNFNWFLALTINDNQCNCSPFEREVIEFATMFFARYCGKTDGIAFRKILTFLCRRCIKGIRTSIRPSLAALNVIVDNAIIQPDILGTLVTTLSFMSLQKMYFQWAWDIFGILFQKSYGCEVVKILQKLMTGDLPRQVLEELPQDTQVMIARGAVFSTAMAFWGPEKFNTFNLPISFFIGPFLKAMQIHTEVCKEVLHAVHILVMKHASTIDPLSWEAIIKILGVTCTIEDINMDRGISKAFSEIMNRITILNSTGNFTGPVDEFYQVKNEVEQLLERATELKGTTGQKSGMEVRKIRIPSESEMSSRNIEIKAQVYDFDDFFKKAQDLCAGQEPTILKQVDTFFNSPNGRLKLREFQATDSNPAELIFYDRPDSDGPKLSSFVKSKITDVESLKEALSLSMGVKGQVKKTRYLFLYGQTRIHLDVVQDLGTFMELEVCLREDQEISHGSEIAKKIMEELGVKEGDLVKGAYMDKLNQKK